MAKRFKKLKKSPEEVQAEEDHSKAVQELLDSLPPEVEHLYPPPLLDPDTQLLVEYGMLDPTGQHITKSFNDYFKREDRKARRRIANRVKKPGAGSGLKGDVFPPSPIIAGPERRR